MIQWIIRNVSTYASRNIRCLPAAIVSDPIDQLEQRGDDVTKREDTSVDEFLCDN